MSSVKDREPRTRLGSISVPKLKRNTSPDDKLFLHRAGILKAGLADNSGEMIFSPVTRQIIENIKDSTVVLKVEYPIDRSKGEDYFVADNVFEVSKKALLGFIK